MRRACLVSDQLKILILIGAHLIFSNPRSPTHLFLQSLNNWPHFNSHATMIEATSTSTSGTTDIDTWRTSAAKATKLCDALKQKTNGGNSNVAERLESVAHDVATVQQRLLAKEDTILNGGKYADAIERYRNAKDRLDSLQTEHTTLSSMVADETQELTDLITRLDATKKSIKDKGRRMTDTTPLIRIKTAIQTVREEMREMDVRIGILSHLLLQSQLAVAQSNRRMQQLQSGMAGHYDAIDGGGSDEEDDSDNDDF